MLNCVCMFLKICLFIWKSGLQREGGWEKEVVHLLVHFPEGCNGSGWVRVKPGDWGLFQVSPTGGRIQALELPFAAFLRPEGSWSKEQPVHSQHPCGCRQQLYWLHDSADPLLVYPSIDRYWQECSKVCNTRSDGRYLVIVEWSMSWMRELQRDNFPEEMMAEQALINFARQNKAML